MQIAERTIGDLTVLNLKGRLVAADGDDVFRAAVDRLVGLGRTKMLINMDEVPYVDSCGVGALASKYVTLRKRDGQLKLCNLGPRSSRVLAITSS
jgi:anti-sigma B factor antagonist